MKKTIFTLNKTLFALYIVAMTTTSLSAQTFVNGSFDGVVDRAIAPTGWTIGSESPDINDVNNPAFAGPSEVPAIDSNDGGTWVGMWGRYDPYEYESIFQNVGGFTIGESYTVNWETAHFGAYDNGTWHLNYNHDAAIDLLIDDSLAFSGPSMTLGDGWLNEEYTFTATSNSHKFEFRARQTSGEKAFFGYASLDGASVSPSTVPEPSSATLLGLAGTVMLLRKRR